MANLVDHIGTLARTTVSVDELKAHEPQLRELNDWYRENVDSLAIATEVYYETQKCNGILVVDPDSANPGIKGVQPIATDENHISITKPKSQSSLIYKAVNQFVKTYLKSHLQLSPASSTDNHYRQAQVSTVDEFRELLSTNAEPSVIRSFLQKNPEIIKQAFGTDRFSLFFWSCSIEDQTLDVCINKFVLLCDTRSGRCAYFAYAWY